MKRIESFQVMCGKTLKSATYRACAISWRLFLLYLTMVNFEFYLICWQLTIIVKKKESIAFGCFKQLMKRMSANFPHGSAMDQNFTNMRVLIQILDTDLYEHMYHRGDFTHFYFSYRWFLLDFKRELLYEDVFSVWETIWAAKALIFYIFLLV